MLNFVFQDGQSCIHLSQFCNHKIDCQDNSDEGPQCKQLPSCLKMGCAEKCAITWKGPKCYCGKGFEPDSSDETKCVDQDECQVRKNSHNTRVYVDNLIFTRPT